MERAIITADAVGCRDVVLPGQSGLLCERHSLDSLITVMREMLSMPSRQVAAMGRQGRALMQRVFDEQIIIREYRETLTRYLHENA